MKTTLFLSFVLSLMSGCVTLTEHQKALEEREDKVMQNFERFGAIYRGTKPVEQPKPAAQASPPKPAQQPVEYELVPVGKIETDTVRPRQRIRIMDAASLKAIDGLRKQRLPKQPEPGFDPAEAEEETIVVLQDQNN